MIIKDVTDESKCCCSCRHNIRTRHDDDMHVICNCDKDGHYIGYVANFGSVCDEWEGEETAASKEIKLPRDKIREGDAE